MKAKNNNAPPAEYQFKPGQSGNPQGRPKGARNRKPKPREKSPLDEKVDYLIDGKMKRMTRRDVLIHHARSQALKEGNGKLQTQLLDLDEKLEELERHLDYNKWNHVYSEIADARVTCVEDVVRFTGMGQFMYRYHKNGRVMLNPWFIELALENLNGRRFTREEQLMVYNATRMPWKVNWPDWWETDLRGRKAEVGRKTDGGDL